MSEPTQQVTLKGWSHMGCGPWIATLAIHEGWRLITRGKARVTDRCLVPTAAGLRKAKRWPGGEMRDDTRIPCKWVKLGAEDLGVPAKRFHALIRKTPPSG